MKKTVFTIIFLCSLLIQMMAQNKILVSERIFLTPTHVYYDKNDTVEIIGQILSTNYSDFYPYSRYVYLELFDKDSKLVSRQKVRCNDKGCFYATMPLGAIKENGKYYLRGYTQFMRNRKNTYYPTVPLYVGSRPVISTDNHTIKASFFPEGGHLVNNHSQNISIYLCNTINQPIETNYWILKNGVDTIYNGKTSHSGLSIAAFTPEKNANYTLQTPQNKQSFKIPSTERIPTIQTTIHKNRLVCRILSENQESSNTPLHLFIYHNSFGLKEMSIDKGLAVADMTGCTPGVLTIWLTDEQQIPIAQKVLWTSDIKDATELEMKSVFRMNEKLSFCLNDTVPGSQTFVRIVPAWDSQSISSYAMLNFTNELSSSLPFPPYYNEEDEKNRRKDLSSWLLSAKQSMIGIDILKEDSITYPFPIEAGLVVSGTISQDHHPLQEASVQIYNTANQDATITKTDANGHFDAQLKDYADDTKLYMQAYSKKGETGNYLYKLDEYAFPPIQQPETYSSYAEETSNSNTLASYHTRLDSTKTYNLDEVVIARRAANKKQYEWVKNRNPFEYFDRNFFEKKPNLQTLKDIIIYTNLVSVSSDNNCISWKSKRYDHIRPARLTQNGDAVVFSSIALVINGLKINYNISDFLTIPATDIESVELVRPGKPYALYHDAPLGLFDVKMRYLIKKEEISSNGITIQPLGISVPTKKHEIKLPQAEGKYKVLIDVISPDRRINSFVKEIEVKK